MSEPSAAEPRAPASRRGQILLVLAAAVLIPVAASILYTYSPLEYGFYPRCMFRMVTGLNCPGCGATRSVYSLMHGEPAAAFSYNPLFVTALPFMIVVVAQLAWSLCTGRPVRIIKAPVWVAKVVFGLVLVYWIVRNLDIYPFFR
jgi:hypothetical protein